MKISSYAIVAFISMLIGGLMIGIQNNTVIIPLIEENTQLRIKIVKLQEQQLLPEPAYNPTLKDFDDLSR